ncbi:MAG: lipoyl(octanoyl) transferase LipB [Alphaproteobacteria bacterium]|nr:lipoyl(octanoyl) transferase LipB [Alphaproteobacteria bacterium]
MSVGWRWLGRVPYADAAEWQRARREDVIAGRRPEILALVEHPRVVTTGRRDAGDLDAVRAAGIPVVATERGGLATWHGPGQLVGYPIVDVGGRGIGVKRFVALVEDVLIGWAAEAGIPAGRRDGHPGVWVGGAKLASVGLHFRRGVSMHGFALNLTADLADFALFTPCGIPEAEVTSASRLGVHAPPEAVCAGLAARFAEAVDTATGRH